MLYEMGYGYIWESQEVNDQNGFVLEFKNRLLDTESQAWRASIANMPKLGLYSLFKVNLETERYLLLDMRREYRVALAKFRVGSHDLEIEKGRQLGKIREERICKFCNLDIEDEYHVLMHCSSYEELRLTYIEDEYRTPRNLYTFCNLLSSERDTCIINLSRYVYHMFSLRCVLICK